MNVVLWLQQRKNIFGGGIYEKYLGFNTGKATVRKNNLYEGGFKMLILIGIIYIIYHLVKEAAEDEQIRQWCARQGYDTYPSSTGMKDMKTGKHCWVDPRTGEKTLW